MNRLSLITQPILPELTLFDKYFADSLAHTDGLLNAALTHVRQRTGKRMRPVLMLLIAKAFGTPCEATIHAAVGLELLHTASLVHDDVVDESCKRRGQASVNAVFDNKVAVLIGDYILSSALRSVALSGSADIVLTLAELGQTLSNGEIEQIANTRTEAVTEEAYFEVIKKKTASLFVACAEIGALSVAADAKKVEAAKMFGENLGVIFQIRDDIFDYYTDDTIGKPTGNDMAEGKLTLPLIYAVNTPEGAPMLALAQKVKRGEGTSEDIRTLVDFAKTGGGIDYARRKMEEYYGASKAFLDEYVEDEAIRTSLTHYLDYVIDRSY